MQWLWLKKSSHDLCLLIVFDVRALTPTLTSSVTLNIEILPSVSQHTKTHTDLKKSAHTDTHLQTPTFGKKHLNNFINPLYGRVRSHCVTGLWKECSGVKKEAASMLLS